MSLKCNVSNSLSILLQAFRCIKYDRRLSVIHVPRYRQLNNDSSLSEHLSIERRRKTKTKVITLANHKLQRRSSEPIKTSEQIIHVTDAKRGKACASESRLVLVLLLIG